MKKGVILIIFLGIFLFSLQNIEAKLYQINVVDNYNVPAAYSNVGIGCYYEKGAVSGTSGRTNQSGSITLDFEINNAKSCELKVWIYNYTQKNISINSNTPSLINIVLPINYNELGNETAFKLPSADIPSGEEYLKRTVNSISPQFRIYIIIAIIIGFILRTLIQALFFRIFTKKYNLPQSFGKAFLTVLFPALILNLLALVIIFMKLGNGLLLLTWVLFFPLLIISTKLVYKTETKIATFITLKYLALMIIILFVASTIKTVAGTADFFTNLRNILVG